MKTKNIFEDAMENCIWVNPYCAIYKYNVHLFRKLYKHTFTRMSKSECNDVSCHRHEKANKNIPASGYDKCNYLTRYGMTDTRDKNPGSWQRKQI